MSLVPLDKDKTFSLEWGKGLGILDDMKGRKRGKQLQSPGEKNLALETHPLWSSPHCHAWKDNNV